MKKSNSSRFRKFGIVLGALVLVLGACSAGAALTLNYLNPPLTAFYTPPNPLSLGASGEIIKTEKIQTNYANVQAWRVMYHSRDLRGNDVAITGIFAAPASARAEGYPLIAVAHGTEGLGRQCASSLDPWGLPQFAQEFFSFPDTVIVPFVQAGYAVAATDYQGLGAPGDASFLIGSIEAQNVLDSIRAIRNFDAVKLNDQTFVWGHSQGGHAAAFTAQLASEIAPEINLHGIVLGAPAARLQDLVNTILVPDKPSALTGVAMMVAGSWHQTYDLALEGVFTPKGIQELPRVYQECILGTIATFNADKPSAYYFSNPTTTSPWRDLMLLNTPQMKLYPAPVFVAQGESDPIISAQTTRAFVEQLCATGNAVQFNVYANADHLGTIAASRAEVLAWLAARAKNETAPSNCATQVTMSPTPIPPLAFQSVIFSDGAFTPAKATIAALENQLPNFLAQNQKQFSAQKSPIAERLTQYKFQYWGEMQNAKRVIVVNAFCANFENWKTQRVFVLDGGDCFFQIKYDMDSETFFDLQVNGEA